MVKVFFSVSFCVIVFSVVVMLLPSETYAKYAKVVCGVLAVAMVISVVFNADIDFTFSERLAEEMKTVNHARSEAVKQGTQILTDTIEDRLYEKYNTQFNVTVSGSVDAESKLLIESFIKTDEAELKNFITDICGIEGENIIVEYNQE